MKRKEKWDITVSAVGDSERSDELILVFAHNRAKELIPLAATVRLANARLTEAEFREIDIIASEIKKGKINLRRNLDLQQVNERIATAEGNIAATQGWADIKWSRRLFRANKMYLRVAND